MPSHTEHAFETAIESGLVGAGGYARRVPAAYHEGMALFPEDVVGFLKDSQPKVWGQLEPLLGSKTEATVLDSLAMEHHTITRHDELEFIADRSIKQAVATQAPVALILSPLLTGGKVFKA